MPLPSVNVTCPHCKHSQTADTSAGDHITCQACGRSFSSKVGDTLYKKLKTHVLEQNQDQPLEPGTLCGVYKVTKVLGRGGMATVYEAEQISLGKPVALKIMSGNLLSDPQFAKRFVREAEAMLRLDHPNIVKIIDRGDFEGRPFLVMDLETGGTLRPQMADGPMPWEKSVRIMLQVLDALSYAHSQGAVHRDVKPENIMFDAKGNVKLTDFGLVRLADKSLDTRLTQTHMVMGTAEYMSPEQREGHFELDHRADLYAAGVVFYEMIMGELPIGRFHMPGEKSSSLKFLDRVIDRALKKDPTDRYDSADDMKRVLEGFLLRDQKRLYRQEVRTDFRVPVALGLTSGTMHALVWVFSLFLLPMMMGRVFRGSFIFGMFAATVGSIIISGRYHVKLFASSGGQYGKPAFFLGVPPGTLHGLMWVTAVFMTFSFPLAIFGALMGSILLSNFSRGYHRGHGRFRNRQGFPFDRDAVQEFKAEMKKMAREVKHKARGANVLDAEFQERAANLGADKELVINRKVKSHRTGPIMHRSTQGFLGGVCRGLAEGLSLPPALIRIFFAVLTVVSGGLFALAYGLYWAFVHKAKPEAYKTEEHFEGSVKSSTGSISIFAVSSFLLSLASIGSVLLGLTFSNIFEVLYGLGLDAPFVEKLMRNPYPYDKIFGVGGVVGLGVSVLFALLSWVASWFQRPKPQGLGFAVAGFLISLLFGMFLMFFSVKLKQVDSSVGHSKSAPLLKKAKTHTKNFEWMDPAKDPVALDSVISSSENP